jgi:hypothetical protein
VEELGGTEQCVDDAFNSICYILLYI